MDSIQWHQNILLVSSDSKFRGAINKAFGDESTIFSATDGDEALGLMELHQFKVFILDDLCLVEDTKKWSPGISAKDICKEAHKNHNRPKIMILSSHISELGVDYLEKTKASLIMNRQHLSTNRIIYLVRLLRNRTYRTILSRDFIKAKEFKCPLYKFNPLHLEKEDQSQVNEHSGYELFLEAGEKIQPHHLSELIKGHVYHLFVKENDLYKFIESFPDDVGQDLFSTKMNDLRKNYRSFLLDFSDDTKVGKKGDGIRTFEKGEEIINQLSALISGFKNPLTCIEQLPYPRMSDLSHGLNTAIYTLIFGRLCDLKESPKRIALAALIHNIGVMDLDQEIIVKDHRALTPEENKIYEKHVSYSLSIAKRHYLFEEKVFSNVLYYHHENCDGSGYPEGLFEKRIPDESALVAIASTYNYLKTVKVGEGVISPKEALKRLLSIQGKENKKYKESILTKIEQIFA